MTIKKPVRVGKTSHEGDGAAYVEILDADGHCFAAVHSWYCEGGGHEKPTQRDFAYAQEIVDALNAVVEHLLPKE